MPSSHGPHKGHPHTPLLTQLWPRWLALVAFCVIGLVLAPTDLPPAHAQPPVVVSPGDMVRLSRVEFGCTVGVAAANYVITAGHCGQANAIGKPVWRDYGLPSPIGRLIAQSDSMHLDYALIELNRGIRVRATRVAQRAPHIGDRVCKRGRWPGIQITCGHIRAISFDSFVADVPGIAGDSGSGLWYRNTGEILGVLRGPDPQQNPALPWSTPGTRTVFTRIDAITYDIRSRLGITF